MKKGTQGCHHGGPQELCAMYWCEQGGAKDPGLYKADIPLMEQAF